MRRGNREKIAACWLDERRMQSANGESEGRPSKVRNMLNVLRRGGVSWKAFQLP